MNISKDLFGFQFGFKYRVLWLTGSAASLLWFSYWIYYDVSVWSKPLGQVNSVNLTGLVLSLALILFGTLNGKFPKRIGVEALVKTQEQKPQTIKPPVQVAQRSQELKLQPKPSDIHGCLHSLGYLRKREKSAIIPNECLTCPKVIDCMSPGN